MRGICSGVGIHSLAPEEFLSSLQNNIAMAPIGLDLLRQVAASALWLRRVAVGKLGKRVRQARIAKGLSLGTVAKGLCTKANLSAVELGKTLPSPRLLIQICRVLELPLEEIAFCYAEETSAPANIRIICEQLRTEGKTQAALSLLERLVTRVGQEALKPSVYMELGRVYGDLERFSDAQIAFMTAVETAITRGMWEVVTEALCECGIACCFQGKFVDAIEYLVRSASASSHKDWCQSKLITLFCLASCFLRVGMNDKALRVYDHTFCKADNATYNGAPLSALISLGMGVSYYNMQKYDEALAANDRVIKLLSGPLSCAEYGADAHNNGAVYLLDLGQCGKAQDALIEALHIRRMQRDLPNTKKTVYSLTEQARLHLQRGRSSQAKQVAEQAMCLAQRFVNVPEQGRLHALLSAVSPCQSEFHEAHILRLSQEFTTPEERAWFYSSLGRVFMNTKFESVGMRFAEKALSELQALSRIGVLP